MSVDVTGAVDANVDSRSAINVDVRDWPFAALSVDSLSPINVDVADWPKFGVIDVYDHSR